jgi:hypothetical protein
MNLEQPTPGQVQSQEEAPQPKVSWIKQAYQRAQWIRVRYGKRVLPQAQQRSNISLTDEQVMSSRTEPVRHSHAFPLDMSGERGAEQSPGKAR